ncbi:unnamed protein product [Danaus chrysippus]|uniref:(African queen) hypothetical protein n=1 Tax=Danaus chrysippus TaxID=151541 RepID=A0A8J2Q9V6_9NEOP|nr:unnamed protein product [Danaus chrysippus]
MRKSVHREHIAMFVNNRSGLVRTRRETERVGECFSSVHAWGGGSAQSGGELPPHRTPPRALAPLPPPPGPHTPAQHPRPAPRLLSKPPRK